MSLISILFVNQQQFLISKDLLLKKTYRFFVFMQKQIDKVIYLFALLISPQKSSRLEKKIPLKKAFDSWKKNLKSFLSIMKNDVIMFTTRFWGRVKKAFLAQLFNASIVPSSGSPGGRGGQGRRAANRNQPWSGLRSRTYDA